MALGGLVLASVTLLGAAGVASVAHAQLVAPHIEALPDIELPADVPPPDGGVVQVVVVIAADATASVEQCDAGEALCALVRDAVARGRFAPATRDGVAVSARVSVALRIAVEPPAAPETRGRPAEALDAGMAPDAASPPSPDAGAAPTTVVPEDDPHRTEFGAVARVVAPNDPGRRRLELSETRDLPGAFGDPFRAIDSLPGIVPVLSGLPYYYVRGSPPAGTLYIYDDIPLPTLYHLAVGPAVIHPRMVGPIELYAGVAPARYGRQTGGVIVGEGPDAPDGETHAEAELRLLDVSAYVQTPALGGNVTAAARYGYPALLLSIFSPTVSLAYWDYQLRYTGDQRRRDRFDLVALGSYDSLGVSDQPDQAIRIQFHRFEPRFIHRIGRGELGVALMLGWEESALGAGFQLQSTRISPRIWLEQRLGGTAQLRLSADMIGVAGSFSSQVARDRITDEQAGQSLVGSVPARTLWGLQAELDWKPTPLLELRLGTRADAWVQNGGAMAVVDPRARVILHLTPELEVHGALGVTHQPAVFYVPLPGIEDVATSRGLQTAIQSELGFGWDTPLGVRLEVQGYLHHYDGLVFTDVLLLGDTLQTICASIDCPGGSTVQDRISGYSYGAEIFARRAPENRLSGFLSYTLGWSHTDDVVGLHYTPSWDVRHVLNLVTQWDLGHGFSIGARLHARSGKMSGQFLIDDSFQLRRDEQRLPWFVRLDLQVAYSWHPSWGRMRLSLEWFNATMSREPTGVDCTATPGTCVTQYLPAIFFPNLGLRGEL